MGDSPKWVKSKKQRRKKREKERERERLNNGDNNGQATHGARKHAWRTQAAWAKTLVHFLLGFLCNFVSAENRVSFSEGYSVHERPPTEEGKPLLIECSINLRNIMGVAEMEQIISLETTFRLYWKVGIFRNLLKQTIFFRRTLI